MLFDDDEIVLADKREASQGFTPERGPSDEELRAMILAQEAEEILKSHTLLEENYVGTIEHLSAGLCQTSFMTRSFMQADNDKMVFSGFIAAAAEYAAMAAINEPNAMMLFSQSKHLSPVRVGDEIKFEAKVKHNEYRKRDIDVVGRISSIKVFMAHITVVITDYHPLKVNLADVAKG